MGIVPQSKMLLVGLPVRAHAWVTGSVLGLPSWCAHGEGNQLGVLAKMEA